MFPARARWGLFSAEAIQAARAENRKMKDKKCEASSALCLVPGSNGASARVIDRGESYEQPLETVKKKAEGKKRKSPSTPLREKGKGKETQTGFLKETVLPRAGARARCARARASEAALLDAELDVAVREFGGTAADRRMWAAIAWRVGAEAFHFAVRDKLAEDAVDGRPRHPAAALQAFLNERFPKGGAA